MDFFRSLFPRTRNEHLVQGINSKQSLITTEIFIDQPSQSNTNLNDLDSMNNKDLPVTDPLQLNETNLDQNITQKNITSTQIHANNGNKTTIDELKDALKEETILNNTNNNVDKFMEVEGRDNTKCNNESVDIDIKNNVVCKDSMEITPCQTTEDKDDETLKNLQEFEDTLKEFDKTCIGVNCGHEIIDLDDFDEFVGQLDCDDTTVNNDPKVDLNNSKCSLRTLENIDIISIVSSNDDAKSQIINTQDLLLISSENEAQLDGYNSSDFEFITEEEANMDGFIININKGSQDFDSSSLSSSEPLSNYVSNKKEISSFENIDAIKAVMDPEAGPSGLNKAKNEFEDRSYRKNHILPEGDEYLGLFRGIYNPLMPVCEIIFLENKSVRASAMNIQYDGIGFDKQLLHKKYKPDSSEDEFEDEAKKCAQKILTMYPGENRKRRRRF